MARAGNPVQDQPSPDDFRRIRARDVQASRASWPGVRQPDLARLCQSSTPTPASPRTSLIKSACTYECKQNYQETEASRQIGILHRDEPISIRWEMNGEPDRSASSRAPSALPAANIARIRSPDQS